MTRARPKLGGRSAHHLYFDDHTMDFNTQYLLGYASGKGAAVGEVLNTIASIRSGDLKGWVRAWTAIATQVEDEARRLALAGHRVSAREAFLRATTYHRAVTFGLAEDDPRLAHHVERLSACFAEAAGRMDFPCEAVRIPYGSRHLPGYLMRPAADARPRPTLITIGGGELYNEELYFWTGEAGVARDWNVLVVDLPGQGSTSFDGMVFEPHTEHAFAAICDFLERRPGVDPARICAVGVSLGGYLVLRAASMEPRLSAIALSTPMPAPRDWLLDGVPFRIDRLSPRWMDRLFGFIARWKPQMGMAFGKWFARLGVSRFSEALEVLRGWQVDLERVRCPVLCLLGEGEARTFALQTERAVRALGDRATYRLATVREGADGHCQSNHFPKLQSLVFDWLGALPAAQTAR